MSRLSGKMFLSKIQSSIKKENNSSLKFMRSDLYIIGENSILKQKCTMLIKASQDTPI